MRHVFSKCSTLQQSTFKLLSFRSDLGVGGKKYAQKMKQAGITSEYIHMEETVSNYLLLKKLLLHSTPLYNI